MPLGSSSSLGDRSGDLGVSMFFLCATFWGIFFDGCSFTRGRPPWRGCHFRHVRMCGSQWLMLFVLVVVVAVVIITVVCIVLW